MLEDNNDILIDKINYSRKKRKEAEIIIEDLSPYLEVGPVDSLSKILNGCKGETVIDKIYYYFEHGGKIEHFYSIKGEQIAFYYKNKKTNSNKIYENSLKSYGAKSEKVERKRKSVSKESFRRLLLAVLASAVLILGGYVGNYFITQHNEEVQFKNAIYTIEDNYILEQGFTLSAAKKLGVLDLTDFDVIDFGNYLKSLDLSEHSVIYIIYDVAGKETADEFCRKCYSASLDKILRDDFPSFDDYGNKYGDYDKFANCCQLEITKKGVEISKKLEAYEEKSVGGKH